ncbi:rifin PIR protein, putative [Plasmodium reichenowi]|uniref:Rifin PIR protein, putative n=1 Tax=Plasmodium reichenowi TaxID=5854 RepID=A0A2P9DCI2_PLARE|nr:rifin PIR protein, putative [Plasmodium reichenowi]
MKVHCINILLLAVPLNILINSHKKTSVTPHDTHTNRSLCECELYAPANYDNDPQMKKVMENFNKQTQQRFHEYDDRMVEKRKQCKDKCDKEIQKIILKDKLEKELMDKFVTLQTDIQNDAIPTCVCEKSIADKVEKGCFRCGGILGTAMPELGSIGGSLLSALYAWKPKALEAAARYAMKEGLAVGKFYGEAAGKNAVIGGLRTHFFIKELGIDSLESYFTTKYNFDIQKLAGVIYKKREVVCGAGNNLGEAACERIGKGLGTIGPDGRYGPPDPSPIIERLNGLAERAEQAADYVTETISGKVTNILTRQQTSEIAATHTSFQTTIIASIVAIVVIILIMVIIYLILRYRRKKKMKKKLQYIKLLEE